MSDVELTDGTFGIFLATHEQIRPSERAFHYRRQLCVEKGTIFLPDFNLRKRNK
ncbi:hypothetical protein G3N57_00045 [Paraburkholderia sp. Se-20369]|nr:hypothetical protein [Paraburkholderia sp. Se-20369]